MALTVELALGRHLSNLCMFAAHDVNGTHNQSDATWGSPLMTDSLDSAASARLESVGQLLQVCCSNLGQQGLGELGLILASHHKVLVLEVTHILIPQILHDMMHNLGGAFAFAWRTLTSFSTVQLSSTTKSCFWK